MSQSAEPRDKKKGRAERSVAWLTLGVAAAAVAVLGGGGVIVALNSPEPAPTNAPGVPSALEPHGPPEPAPTAVAQREADDLRKLAKLDCDQDKWSECVSKLDKAYDLDPQGNLAWPVKRMREKAMRATTPESEGLKAGSGKRVRELDATARAEIAAMLRGDAGAGAVGWSTRAQLVCAAGAQPGHLCDQLAATLKKAGWTVARAALQGAADAAAMRGLRVEVAANADDTTQAAADALAGGLTSHGLVPQGPDDMTPEPGSPPLRITVGIK